MIHVTRMHSIYRRLLEVETECGQKGRVVIPECKVEVLREIADDYLVLVGFQNLQRFSKFVLPYVRSAYPKESLVLRDVTDFETLVQRNREFLLMVVNRTQLRKPLLQSEVERLHSMLPHLQHAAAQLPCDGLIRYLA